VSAVEWLVLLVEWLVFAEDFADFLPVEFAVAEVALLALLCSTAGAVIGTITSNVDNNSPKTDSEAISLLLTTLLATLTPLL